MKKSVLYKAILNNLQLFGVESILDVDTKKVQLVKKSVQGISFFYLEYPKEAFIVQDGHELIFFSTKEDLIAGKEQLSEDLPLEGIVSHFSIKV